MKEIETVFWVVYLINWVFIFGAFIIMYRETTRLYHIVVAIGLTSTCFLLSLLDALLGNIFMSIIWCIPGTVWYYKTKEILKQQED